MTNRIDPDKITDYERDRASLELFWVFSACVAGKTARTQARLLEKFLDSLPHAESPFGRIRLAIRDGVFEDKLRDSRLGQYGRIGRYIRESLDLDLSKASVAELEKIHGCGPKTARMFVMHSRKNQRVAALDTHVLKLLRDEGHAVPKATPAAGPTYQRLEKIFLDLADKSGMSVADYDLKVWRYYAAKNS
jgi:hypothetical protein